MGRMEWGRGLGVGLEGVGAGLGSDWAGWVGTRVCGGQGSHPLATGTQCTGGTCMPLVRYGYWLMTNDY